MSAISLFWHVRAIYFYVLPLLVFDIVLVGLGIPYPREKISFFSRKSAKNVLSDLFFLEGATILV